MVAIEVNDIEIAHAIGVVLGWLDHFCAARDKFGVDRIHILHEDAAVGWAKALFAPCARASTAEQMSHCRRARIEGGVFFFTVTLADRSSDPLVREIDRLRRVYAPFETVAICVLPEQIHAIWEPPPNDSDFRCAGA